MMTENTPHQQYNSLLAIRVRKMELQKQLNEQENKINHLWHGLFHEEKSNLPKTPSQRIMAMATTGMGIIDGAILGWKLYRKFRR